MIDHVEFRRLEPKLASRWPRLARGPGIGWRYAFWPFFATWGVEVTRYAAFYYQGAPIRYTASENGIPIKIYQRRVKIGPIVFPFGFFSRRQEP